MGDDAVPSGPVTVVTVVRGRLEHLRRQAWGLDRQQGTPFRWVVVRMGGPDVAEVLAEARTPADVLPIAVADRAPLPLAAARNLGISAAVEGTVVLLDVDVVPSPGLVARYARAVRQTGSVVAGPVGYLPPGVPATPADLDRLQQAGVPPSSRPVPPDGALLPEPRWELLWTLSMALPTRAFRAAGGFDERYVGYGGEDTDFALRLHGAGETLHWVGGAWGYHQHHAESGRRDKVADIVRNSLLFRSTWGWWPMAGWLADLRRDGIVEWDPDGDTLRLIDP